MPSPFPGMDPYFEGPEWDSFHAWFVADLSDVLSELVAPQYVLRMDRREYVQEQEVFPRQGRQPLLREPHREPFARILVPKTREVVTVIDVLSPANKCPGMGRRKYLDSRNRTLNSSANLVELDLLRGGDRLPMRGALPPCDYCAVISRAATRPRADVFVWTIREPLPSIPIPLRGNEPDVMLDLQPAFESRYDRAHYGSTLNYSMELRPPLSEADAAWSSDWLKSFRRE